MSNKYQKCKPSHIADLAPSPSPHVGPPQGSPSPTTPLPPSHRQSGWVFFHKSCRNLWGPHILVGCTQLPTPDFLHSSSTGTPALARFPCTVIGLVAVFALMGAATAQGRRASAPVQLRARSSGPGGHCLALSSTSRPALMASEGTLAWGWASPQKDTWPAFSSLKAL